MDKKVYDELTECHLCRVPVRSNFVAKFVSNICLTSETKGLSSVCSTDFVSLFTLPAFISAAICFWLDHGTAVATKNARTRHEKHFSDFSATRSVSVPFVASESAANK